MMYYRGDQVIATCYGGKEAILRVWDLSGTEQRPGILLCSDVEYQRAIRERDEPLYVGYPRMDVRPYRKGP